MCGQCGHLLSFVTAVLVAGPASPFPLPDVCGPQMEMGFRRGSVFRALPVVGHNFRHRIHFIIVKVIEIY